MLIMLTLPLYTNTLPLYQNRKDRIMKTSTTFFSVEITIEKNGRRENKQNVC